MFGALLNLVKRWVPSLLPTLLTERPDLIVDHALAYVALAAAAGATLAALLLLSRNRANERARYNDR